MPVWGPALEFPYILSGSLRGRVSKDGGENSWERSEGLEAVSANEEHWQETL